MNFSNPYMTDAAVTNTDTVHVASIAKTVIASVGI